VLAAMAAGCVVVLPHRYAETFGDAAVYANSGTLTETVRGLHSRQAALRKQSNLSREYVRQRHGHGRYADHVTALTG
jgi:hypothetical protein